MATDDARAQARGHGHQAKSFQVRVAVLSNDELRVIGAPVLLVTGARSAMLTPAQAHDRGSLMRHADVAVVPGSHGGFNRIDEVNYRIAAFIKAQSTDRQLAPPPAARQ
jgi:pimeloyl-ACP methyl ester carboxylesterase